MQKKRIQWIDFAKGITILLVIIGHTIYQPLVRGALFAFHMPLFFVLSLMTYRVSTSYQEILSKSKKSFRHLIIPAISVWFIQSFVLMITGEMSLTEAFMSLFWSAGIDVTVYSSLFAPALGMCWFLIVLFESRIIYDLLNIVFDKKVVVVLAISLGIFGIQIGLQNIWLPFSLDIALAVLPFLVMGSKLKSYDFSQNAIPRMVLCGLLYVVSYLALFLVTRGQYLGHAARWYPLGIISYVPAIFGVMAFCYFSVIMEQIKVFHKRFIYLFG